MRAANCEQLQNQPELEPSVLREIRVILDEPEHPCDSIVSQIKMSSESQLEAIEPENPERRWKLKSHLQKVGLRSSRLIPLVDTFALSMTNKLGVLKAKCNKGSRRVQENETRELEKAFKRASSAGSSFREHFFTTISLTSIFGNSITRSKMQYSR